MTKMNKTLIALGALLASGAALAAGADLGNTAKQATNWTAIAMFGIFVAFTLWITKWAAGKTKTAADFYTGRWWYYRFPERSGDCGRLHVGCFVPGYFRPGVRQRL